MSTDRINYLLGQYAANIATNEEVEELFEWLREHNEDESLQAQLENIAATTPPNQNYDPAYWEPFINSVLRNSDQQTPAVHRIPFFKTAWFRYAAAAAILILVTTVAYFVISSVSEKSQPVANVNNLIPDDATPGKQGAILTLANGQRVVLDSLGNGVITTQGKTTVLIENGQLVYDAKAAEDEVLYNTMTTPQGRQYQLVLPDGSQVWLNAASSITYPTSFSLYERKVTITGEAYFEVAKDKTKPFRVNVNNESEIEVLGTHFNINSYGDEGSIKTTLLEGSVRVISRNNDEVTLKPGQQAIQQFANVAVSSDRQSRLAENIIVKTDPDLDQVMAWKNGLFNFDHADLKTVMAQLARWYDMDVKYEDSIPPRTFRGKITRDLNLSQVIKILEVVEVKFRIEGKTLIVTQ